ncbi:MAG: hypothetical protein O6704_05555 [Nitrospinae bacterium]|nr:hypothetical protein [Nitrospinota bacterium]
MTARPDGSALCRSVESGRIINLQLKENVMLDCCGSNWSEFMKDKLEFKIEETEKGIRIEGVPKDPAKKQAFQDLIKACREFCGFEDFKCC